MGPTFETIQALEERREDFLDQVLRFRLGESKSPRRSKQGPRVIAHGFRERLRVSLPEPREKIGADGTCRRHSAKVILPNSVRNSKLSSLTTGCKFAAQRRIRDGMAMDIEILYFEGCPNHSAAVARVREALREEGVSAAVSEVNVSDSLQVLRFGFLGSPSIRVNGLDVEPAARSNRDFGTCRTYPTGNRMEGVPSLQMIRYAIREACAAAGRKY